MQDLQAEKFAWDVPLADESPFEPFPDIPTASENYWYTANNPKNRLAFFVSIGRWVKDTSVWRAYFTMILPDGTLLLSQAFGKGDCSRGPVSASIATVCQEPGKRVDLRFSGPVQHVPLHEIANPTPYPTVLDNLVMDLTFEGTAPMWYFPESKNTVWSNWHTEQTGMIKGSVVHNDKRYEFEGFAARDHSRGPRELNAWRGHTWLNGQLEDGSGFYIYQHWLVEDGVEVNSLGKAKIIRDSEYFDATVVSTPRLVSLDGVMNEFEIGLESEFGPITVRGFPRAMAFLSVMPSFSHFYPGIASGLKEWPMSVMEQPTRYEVNGRVGHGWAERSFYRHGIEAQISDRDLLAKTYSSRE